MKPQKTLIKMYANAVFARPYYANADFANAKNAKIILHKHEKQRKNDARAQRTQNRTQTPRNWTKNSPNAPQQVTSKLPASYEQVRFLICKSLYNNSLCKCNFCIAYYANVYFALSLNANADFATRLHYVYDYVYVYVYDLKRESATRARRTSRPLPSRKDRRPLSAGFSKTK